MLAHYLRAGLLGVSLSVIHPGSMQAQSDPAQTVKDRQAIMKMLWPNYYKELSQSADLPAAAAKASEASETVRRLNDLFPVGTDREVVPDTRATPAVWSERAEFEAAIARLADETDKLGELARSGDAPATRAQFAKVAEACGGCHGGPVKSGGKFRFEAQ